jgi:hypothetical protein
MVLRSTTLVFTPRSTLVANFGAIRFQTGPHEIECTPCRDVAPARALGAPERERHAAWHPAASASQPRLPEAARLPKATRAPRRADVLPCHVSRSPSPVGRPSCTAGPSAAPSCSCAPTKATVVLRPVLRRSLNNEASLSSPI